MKTLLLAGLTITAIQFAAHSQGTSTTGNLESQLLQAAVNGRAAEVQDLIQKGANASAANESGFTPLYVASQSGHTEVVKLLLKARAVVDPTMPPNESTPLSISSGQGHVEVVKLLLAGGAKVDRVTLDGFTPLIYGAQNGHADVVKALLTAGAKVNNPVGARTKNGQTALMMASQHGFGDVVKILLAAGADVNRRAGNGATPLMLASDGGYVDVVKLLLAAKADVNAVAPNGATASVLATQKGHLDIIPLLQANGAAGTTVPVSVVEVEGHEIPSSTDLADFKYTDTTYRGHVELGASKKVGLGNLTLSLAPDLVSVLIDGRDMGAVQAPVDTQKGGADSNRSSAYRLNTKTLGVLIALDDYDGKVVRLLLTPESVF